MEGFYDVVELGVTWVVQHVAQAAEKILPSLAVNYALLVLRRRLDRNDSKPGGNPPGADKEGGSPK